MFRLRHMKLKITIYFLLVCCVLTSQNLVLNPSFETYERCPYIIGTFSSNVAYWNIPNLGTTDFFSTCSKRIGSSNYNGYQAPKHGKTFAGFYLFSPDDYREYTQGKLSKKLESGQKYRMKFYISLAENATHAIPNISVLFTEDVLGFKKKSTEEKGSVLTNKKSNYLTYNNISKTYIKPKKYTKQAYQIYDITLDTFYKDRVNWMEVSFEFTASGFERYFTIGNFKSNKKTQTLEILKTTKTKHQISYYYIDDVSVVPLDSIINTVVVKPAVPTINTDEVYVFKNVLFNFDEAELLEVSIYELNSLYKHLKNNPNLNIEIYGHTDALGLDRRNKELSTQRAKAVADYLISQGLDPSKIKSFGFGSIKPISLNTTEEGRKLNRRVEFKLIDN